MANFAIFAQRTIEKLFSRHLFLTNTVTYIGLYSLGDIIQQKLEQIGTDIKQPIDWKRTGRMATFACFLGPCNHYWYTFLDKFIPGRTGRIVLKKIICDQLCFAPFAAVTFYAGMGYLEGKDSEGVKDEVKKKFLVTYMADLGVWPAAQAINFFLLPPRFRVMYVNFVTLSWNTFLSYMKHNDTEDIEVERITAMAFKGTR